MLRAFWGRYFEGTATPFYTLGDAGHPGLHLHAHQRRTVRSGRPEVVTPAFVYGISDDIKHPRTDEFNVAWENQLTQERCASP